MKRLVLVFATTCMTLFALYNHNGLTEAWANWGASSQQQETTVINLDYSNLTQPHNLVVTSPQPDTKLNGEITVNGKVIKVIRGNRATVNLSNSLSKGRNTIEVQGNYKPVSSSIQVEFSAPGTLVSQSTAGNGKIGQTLIIEVR